MDLGQEVDDLLGEMETVLSQIPARLQDVSVDVDGVLLTAEWLLRDVTMIEPLLPRPEGECLVNSISDVVVSVQSEVDRRSFQPRRGRGRPAIDIPEQQLRVLLEHHFTTADIGRMLHVSARTIRRRILQYGLESVVQFSDLSDDQLDGITAQFVHTHPFCGRVSYQGFLRSVGLHIQQARVYESLRRVDQRGLERRFRLVLRRRQYSVCMPNSLWHIDGHHKLIRWRIVTHGGIDGFSRLIVYMSASSNNKAATVLASFLRAIDQHGLPSRVRCDKGGENVMVSQFMITHPNRGPGRSSCITGRSVHNQRIERLWRDLYVACIALYHTLFLSLEDEGLLDPGSDMDLFCLHYVFLPRINHSLNVFRESYNHHPIRTAGNRTPYQLWIGGMTERSGDDAAVQGLDENVIPDDYGIDWGSPNGTEENCVVVPLTPSPLSQAQLDVLKHTINPLESTADDYGISLYAAVKAFVCAL